TFLAIARDTAGDDIFPVLTAALGDRHHMIKRQIARRESVAAILAPVVVAGVDVGARKRDVIEAALDLDVPEQADDRRQLETERDRPDFAVVDGDHLHLPLAPERDRLLPVDDLERLVRRVEEKRLFQGLLEFCPTAVEVSSR